MIRDLNGLYLSSTSLITEIHMLLDRMNGYGDIDKRVGKIELVANPEIIGKFISNHRDTYFESQNKHIWYKRDESLPMNVLHLKESDRIFATILDFIVY